MKPRSRRPRAHGPGSRPRGQRGFTLIELMIALVVSSLLVGMILAIFMRMSIAYRGQQQIAEVQSKLAAARTMFERDAKHAGLNMAQGFLTAFGPPGSLRAPMHVINNAAAPDQIAFFYADTQVQAASVDDGLPATIELCTVQQCDHLESTKGFVAGDVIVATRVDDPLIDSPYPGDTQIVKFKACVLQLEEVRPTELVFSTGGTWGSPTNEHCNGIPVPGKTMFYKLIAHHWRINPARPAEGVLQLSPTGNLVAGLDDWQDMAYGFTDLQIATRFYEQGDQIETLNPDDDPERDWYSDEAQELHTATANEDKVPIQVSISLVARTERDVEGIASTSTPKLVIDASPANNPIGDRDAIPLPSLDPALEGNRIFRYTTFQVDLRNLGVGR